ncbi:YbaK/EbsC family protein [Streptomyces sp. NPDC001165]|uniref:YbaK/EbsC family protein n=1 Tax=Streptomyces sp. NPDC001165 TaxID=3364546 RepID=UPI0036B9F7C9
MPSGTGPGTAPGFRPCTTARDLASELRGHPLDQAVKCLVVRVSTGRSRRYVLAVVPGDRRLDMTRVRELDNDWIYFNAARLDLSIALPVPA